MFTRSAPAGTPSPSAPSVTFFLLQALQSKHYLKNSVLRCKPRKIIYYKHYIT